MNLSKIKNDLQQLLQLVDDWHDKGVNELEVDIVLERLRNLYSQIRFGSTPMPETISSAAEQTPKSEAETVNDTEESSVPMAEEMALGVAISIDDVFEDLIPVELMPASTAEVEEAQPSTDVAESDGIPQAELTDKTEDVVQQEVMSKPEEVVPIETSSRPEEIASTETLVEPKNNPISEEPARTEENGVADVVTSQASLFGDEELFVTRTSRRTRLMSLYDDEPTTKRKVETVQAVPTEESAGISLEQSAPESNPALPVTESPLNEQSDFVEPANSLADELTEDEFVEVDLDVDNGKDSEMAPIQEGAVATTSQPEPYIEPQIEVTEAKPAASVLLESEQVLGEVINSNVQTIADVIKPKDIAVEQIVKGSVKELGKAIGVNDRFLLIRDLFGGNGEKYEQAIEMLDGFDTLEDCMIYIVENFDWNPNSDGTKLMMELIERKYS